MGDGVLVYFGYPQAHEDDAERAVRAGLTLIEQADPNLPRPEAIRHSSSSRFGNECAELTKSRFRSV